MPDRTCTEEVRFLCAHLLHLDLTLQSRYPPAARRGRPRADLAAIVMALLHKLRAGCPWRDLPCEGLNWRTVYGYLGRWRDQGV